MKTLPISEVRNNLPKLVDQVDRQFERVLLTKSGKAKAVLMSAEEFDAWQETVEIVSDSKTMKAISVAEADLKAGRVRTRGQ